MIIESRGFDALKCEFIYWEWYYFGIEPKRACALLSTVERAVARWRQIGKDIGMKTSELNAFETAFEHEERLSARRIIGSIK